MTEWMVYIVVAAALAGNWYINRRSRWGFRIWMLTNSCFVIHHVSRGEWAQAFMFFVYLLMAFDGDWHWRQAEIKAVREREYLKAYKSEKEFAREALAQKVNTE